MKTDPGFGLRVMQKRVEDMFQLLNLWQRYVDIIYAPEGEIDVLIQLKEEGGEFSSPSHAGGLADSHFGRKVSEEATDERLKTLFAKTQHDLDNMAAQAEERNDEPYRTVDEGATTDTAVTTEAGGDEFQRSPVDEA